MSGTFSKSRLITVALTLGALVLINKTRALRPVKNLIG